MTNYKAVIFDCHGVLLRAFRRQEELYALASDLRSQGIKTAVLSNMVWPIALAVRRRRYLSSFDPVVVSCEVKMSKPRPAIYKHTLNLLNLRPEECIFIDNRQTNIAAAKSLGFSTIHAKNSHQVVEDLKAMIDYKILNS